MATSDLRAVECLGGPGDGKLLGVTRGTKKITLNERSILNNVAGDANVWHLYRVEGHVARYVGEVELDDGDL